MLKSKKATPEEKSVIGPRLPYLLASSYFANRVETWYSASKYPSAKYFVTEFLTSL